MIKRGWLLLLVYWLTVVPVWAQTPKLGRQTALGVRPAILETVLTPAEPVERSLSIYNLSEFPIPIKTVVESFAPREKLTLPKAKLRLYDAGTWIKVDPSDSDFILQPKESRVINFKILSPKKASPGGHYASITFIPFVPEEIVARDSIFVFGRVTTLNFLQVRGKIKEQLALKSVLAEQIYQRTPLRFQLSLVNRGNTHLRPTGLVRISKPNSDQVLATGTFIPSIILPGGEQQFEVEIAKSLPIGRYLAQAEVTYGVENTLIKSAPQSIYYFPLTSTVINLALAVLLLFLAKRFQNRLIKAWQILRHGHVKSSKKNTIKPKSRRRHQIDDTPLGQIKIKKF